MILASAGTRTTNISVDPSGEQCKLLGMRRSVQQVNKNQDQDKT